MTLLGVPGPGPVVALAGFDRAPLCGRRSGSIPGGFPVPRRNTVTPFGEFDVETLNILQTTLLPGGVLYSGEQLPRCDLLRLSPRLGDSFSDENGFENTPIFFVVGNWCGTRITL